MAVGLPPAAGRLLLAAAALAHAGAPRAAPVVDVTVESVALVGRSSAPRLDPVAVAWPAASADEAMVLCTANHSVMQSTDGGLRFRPCAQQGAAGATLKYDPIGLGPTLRDSRGPGVPQGYQTAPIDGPWTTTQVGAVTADMARREFTFSLDSSTAGQSHWSALPHEAVMLSLGAGDVTPLDRSGLRFLATAAVRYGHHALPGKTHRGHCCNNTVVTFVTQDGGKHWSYHSTIATKESVNAAGWPSQEGPNENSVVLLPDNSTLFAVIRKDGGDGYPDSPHVPYLLGKSSDSGLSWSLKEAPADMLSARPRAVALSGGALIVAGGRPALSFWVSVDGGEHFKAFDIPTLHNRLMTSEADRFCREFENATLSLGWAESSCYTQTMALSADAALICYERQGHGSGGYNGKQPKQCDPAGSSIYCMRVRVKSDDDPRMVSVRKSPGRCPCQLEKFCRPLPVRHAREVVAFSSYGGFPQAKTPQLLNFDYSAITMVGLYWNQPLRVWANGSLDIVSSAAHPWPDARTVCTVHSRGARIIVGVGKFASEDNAYVGNASHPLYWFLTSAESRARAARELAAAVIASGLDGIQVDAEGIEKLQPAFPGVGDAYVEFLAALTTQLRAANPFASVVSTDTCIVAIIFHGIHSRLTYLLLQTFTYGTSVEPQLLESFKLRQLTNVSDGVMMMGYEMNRKRHGVKGVAASQAGPNAPLFNVTGCCYGIDHATRFYLEQGIPASKIWLGIPWYGKVYNCQTPPFAPALTFGTCGSADPYGFGRTVLPYCGVRDYVGSIVSCSSQNLSCFNASSSTANGRCVRRWNEQGASPFLDCWKTDPATKTNTTTQVWYDDPESTAAKCGWARKRGLGGVGVWLGDALYSEFGHRADAKMWDALKIPTVRAMKADDSSAVGKESDAYAPEKVSVAESWAQSAGRYCHSLDIIASYSTPAAAQAACEGDVACLSIYDWYCDGEGAWSTCRSANGASTSSGSCLYVVPGLATCGDVDGEGPGSAAVSNEMCGDGWAYYDTDAAALYCSSASCDPVTVTADWDTCCGYVPTWTGVAGRLMEAGTACLQALVTFLVWMGVLLGLVTICLAWLCKVYRPVDRFVEWWASHKGGRRKRATRASE